MKVIIDIAEPFDEGMLLICSAVANAKGGVTMAEHSYDLNLYRSPMIVGIGRKSTDPCHPDEVQKLMDNVLLELK